MIITKQAEYAIRCVFFLADKHETMFVAGEIAEAMSVPKDFLSKILQKLVVSGILRSVRGVKGGFQLARAAREISLYDVLGAIEGKLSMNECVLNDQECGVIEDCPLHPVWMDLQKTIEEKLSVLNFEDILHAFYQRRNGCC